MALITKLLLAASLGIGAIAHEGSENSAWPASWAPGPPPGSPLFDCWKNGPPSPPGPPGPPGPPRPGGPPGGPPPGAPPLPFSSWACNGGGPPVPVPTTWPPNGPPASPPPGPPPPFTANPSCSSVFLSAIGAIPTPAPGLVSTWLSWERSVAATATLGAYCSVTTALPASLLPAYSSFGSSAWSWMNEHSAIPIAIGRCGPWDAPGSDGAKHINGVLVAGWCYSSAHNVIAAAATPTTWGTSAWAPAVPTSTTWASVPTSIPPGTPTPGQGAVHSQAWKVGGWGGLVGSVIVTIAMVFI